MKCIVSPTNNLNSKRYLRLNCRWKVVMLVLDFASLLSENWNRQFLCMGMEKQGPKSGNYVGGFLQLFDWKAKSRKKLFSAKSDVLPGMMMITLNLLSNFSVLFLDFHVLVWTLVKYDFSNKRWFSSHYVEQPKQKKRSERNLPSTRIQMVKKALVANEFIFFDCLHELRHFHLIFFFFL